MADWCINELRYKASLFSTSPRKPPPIRVYNGDVIKSDYVVFLELKFELQKAISKLEANIPDRLRDWHPGSDEKVWDLVHPSLYPLVYGQTKVLRNWEMTMLDDCIKRSGEGVPADIPPTDQTFEHAPIGHWSFLRSDPPYSAKFQWLPCEVDIFEKKCR